MDRRKFIVGMAAAHLASSIAAKTAVAAQAAATPPASAARPRSKIRQGVMSSVWNGSQLSFEERCQTLARIGFLAIDLPSEAQIPLLRKYGLSPSVMSGTGSSFKDGIIRKELHDSFEKGTRDGIDLCARVGCSNLFVFPGERRGMSREEGAENAVLYFNRFKAYAEEKGITLCMENTNSRVVADQRTDQTFDHVGWGLDVCKRVNSPNVKILYDIYHAQISDGDVTRTLRDNIDWICHIHVAGAPGRLEIDDTQELNYRFLANVIADTGYKGFVSHEWRPITGHDNVAALEKCFRIMDV